MYELTDIVWRVPNTIKSTLFIDESDSVNRVYGGDVVKCFNAFSPRKIESAKVTKLADNHTFPAPKGESNV